MLKDHPAQLLRQGRLPLPRPDRSISGGSSRGRFSTSFSFLTPSLLPCRTHSTHPCLGPARGSPLVPVAVPAAETQGQAGDGDQEAEQSQGSQQDAEEGGEADGQPLAPAARGGEDGEGEAAVDGEGGAVMQWGEAARPGGLVHPQRCCYLHVGPSGRCWHWPPCWQ